MKSRDLDMSGAAKASPGGQVLVSKTGFYLFSEIIPFLLLIKGEGVISEKIKKEKPALLTRTCPPGLALANPDMSKFRLLVRFRTSRVKNLLFEIISK